MAQDNVGKHAQSTPPSFIPAGSRRRTTPAVTPAAQSSGSPVPPSFTPPSRRHGEPAPTTSSTSRSSMNRPASTNRSSTVHSNTAGRTTGHSTNRSTSSSSGPRGAAQSAAPQSFAPPAARARTSRGTTAPRSAQPAAQPAYRSSMPSRNASPVAPIRSANLTGATARRKRRGAKHIASLTVLILLGALALAVFSGWGSDQQPTEQRERLADHQGERIGHIMADPRLRRTRRHHRRLGRRHPGIQNRHHPHAHQAEVRPERARSPFHATRWCRSTANT